MYLSILTASVLVFAGALSFYVRHPAASAFHPATWYLAFHGLVFVIRPWFAWYYGFDDLYRKIGYAPTVEDKTLALLCANLAFVVFMAVALWVAREPIRFPPEAASRQALLRRFWPVAVPLGVVGLAALLWEWNAIARGIEYSVFDYELGAASLRGVSGYFLAAGKMLAPVVAMIAYLGRFRPWSLAPFAVFAIVRLGTGERVDVVAAAAMLALLLLFHLRRKWPTALLVVAALAAGVVFESVREGRGADIRETLRPGVEDLGERGRRVDLPLESMDFAMMETVEYAIWAVPDRTGTYDWFVHNLQVFTEPVPRSLWPGKPVGPPIRMFDVFEGTSARPIAFSVPGVGWMSAGIAGVIVWSAFFGLVYGAAHRWMARRTASDLAVMAYVAFLSTCVVTLRDGVLLSLVRYSALYVLPVAALALLVRYGPRMKSERTTGEAPAR